MLVNSDLVKPILPVKTGRTLMASGIKQFMVMLSILLYWVGQKKRPHGKDLCYFLPWTPWKGSEEQDNQLNYKLVTFFRSPKRRSLKPPISLLLYDSYMIKVFLWWLRRSNLKKKFSSPLWSVSENPQRNVLHKVRKENCQLLSWITIWTG